jgi:ribosomal protein S18 acetylase RimI-like enzyme
MSGEVMIRQAREDDIPAVLELWREADVTPPSPSDSLEGLSALMREPQAVLLLAVVGDQIVGSVIGGWDGWRGNIYRLAVTPAYRRHGIAQLLVTEVSGILFTKGAEKISALVEHDHAWAISFWESLRDLGYQRDPRFARYLADRPLTAPVDTTRK